MRQSIIVATLATVGLFGGAALQAKDQDGLGKDAALYMYPYEGHGPLARETNLDMWARWIAWLDTYVKNPKKK